MNRLMQLLMMGFLMEEAGGDTGGGGGGDTRPNLNDPNTGGLPPDHWAVKSNIPEDLRSTSFVKEAADLNTFVKNAVETKRMVGNAVRIPGENATPEEISSFYEKLGRPKEFTEYAPPEDAKLPDGVSIPDSIMDAAKKAFHDAGLSTSQAQKIFGWYFNHINEAAAQNQAQRQQTLDEQINALKDEWGQKYSLKLDAAKAVVKKFGDENFSKWLDETGMGSNPAFIKMLAGIGETMLDDTSTKGEFRSFMNDAASAKAEIQDLKSNKEFIKALTDERDVGHKSAVARWKRLHDLAYGNEKVT